MTPLKQLLDSREDGLRKVQSKSPWSAPGGRYYLEGGSGGGNRKVFKAERKEERESRARKLSGKEFQMVGAAYENERRPILESIRGQTSVFWYRVQMEREEL